MPVQQHVLNWLYSVLTSEYHDVNRTYSDVARVLSRFSTLSPRTDVHTFPNGASALLLHISGTIPVIFRANTYRFPISIWVPHAYPREPPLIYVTPTETMMVRPGQHVDPQGQVYHPYLVRWTEFWDKSTIEDFLMVLSDVFAKEPPVISRQAQRPTTDARPTPTPPPCLRCRRRWHHRRLRRSLGRAPANPSRLHRPRSLTKSLVHRSLRHTAARQLPARRNPQHHRDTTLRPLFLRNSRAWDLLATARNHRRLWSSNRISRNLSTLLDQQCLLTQIRHQYQTNEHKRRLYPAHAQWQRAPAWNGTALPQPPPPAPPLPNILDEPLTLEIPPQSTVTAPPIPPNPEKDALLRQLAQTLASIRQRSRQQNESSLAGLKAQRIAMQAAVPALQSEMSQLTQLSNVLASNTNILHEALRKADGVIEGSKNHPAPDIDELLVAPTVVSNQLYNLVAEERALGDAIFMLGRAVERGRISPVVFAKMTRSLAREWYLKKALVRKIGQGMGMSS
ncbi:hypothetical protein ACCO45_012354 [Purpureocillium lilacinum]|uniref:Uncharacterized protein n=1 Tax=Purpureocillium lilacinum TaxID=33203 RepID=A0ACC4D7R7_PURLI